MQQAVQPDPAVIQELLRQRGLLATGGNIRMMPFSDPSNGADLSLSAAPGSATANALAQNSGGGITVPDVNGNPVVVSPNATALPANVDDETWVSIMPALAGAAGAGIALLIKNHLSKRGISMPDDPLAPNIVAAKGNGERVVVDGGDLVAEGAAETDPTKAGPKRFPNQSVKQLPKPQGKLTEAELRTRRGVKPISQQPKVNGVIASGDAYSDLSDAEYIQARTIADELIAQRTAGNAKLAAGQKHVPLPTGTTDDKALLNVVVRAIRDAKLGNPIRRAVTR